MPIPVTPDNFVRAETDRYFASLAAEAGGVNRWRHTREPAPVDHQTVVRMNRDTLYSFALVDISAGAAVKLPDGGNRYVSVMVINQDHYVNEVLHDAGRHDLTVESFETPYVVLAARVLADPTDPDDMAEAHAVQDRLGLEAGSARPFESGDYEPTSLDATRTELVEGAKGALDTARMFGRREDVDAADHLVGAAVGWGGLPRSEAVYVGQAAALSLGEYELTARHVPVDAFWSVSVYNAEGYFEPNDRGMYSVNSVTGVKNDDGSITVRFGGCDDGRPNCLPITEGWNYLVRMYRPRPEILAGSYVFPAPERV